MFGSFEVKSYNQLRFYLGVANSFLMFVLLLLSYELVLTENHKQAVDTGLGALHIHPLLSGLSILAMLSGLWGWLSTIVLRLHDRVHEPWIRKWRAGYDADFILRTLCHGQSANISPDLFERAYADKRICRKLMQRLFYSFAGDCTSGSEGRRMFFYTAMWKYWTAALCDLYCLVGITLLAVYHISASSRLSPSLVLGLCAVILISRVFMNSVLDEAHEITLDQIHNIRTHCKEQFEEELQGVAGELSAWRGQA